MRKYTKRAKSGFEVFDNISRRVTSKRSLRPSNLKEGDQVIEVDAISFKIRKEEIKKPITKHQLKVIQDLFIGERLVDLTKSPPRRTFDGVSQFQTPAGAMRMIVDYGFIKALPRYAKYKGLVKEIEADGKKEVVIFYRQGWIKEEWHEFDSMIDWVGYCCRIGVGIIDKKGK